MIIDLSEYLKNKSHICVSDNDHTYGNHLTFTDDNITGFLFNIEVENFIIEVIKDTTFTYDILLWDFNDDSIKIYKNYLHPHFLKEELIYCIEYCEKYKKLVAFS